MLKAKKILIGITGSIAAYKIATLVRLLVKADAEVKVVMTNAAENFISALTLSTLSKNSVVTNLFEENTWANHVALGRWADVMLIAPASCNTIAKMANGTCDNILLAVYLSATCPVIVAPAMDEDMWLHQSTKKNLKSLASYGNIIIPVSNGELASGLFGEGRMAEPEYLVQFLEQYFEKENIKDLLGKKVMITAGPTHEALDPVRFIANHSTGKMGIALANAVKLRGADVTLILGPTNEVVPNNIKVQHVVSAAEMLKVSIENFNDSDIAIMCAAVADYTPVAVAEQKIKKAESQFTLQLKRTEDILKHLGTLKTDKQILVGFALETNNEEANAIKKLQSKNADFIVLNSMRDAGAGFGHQTNKVTIFNKQGNKFVHNTKSKELIAHDILNTILKN
jgi:phosphopantothenoylcysteine decarboxylase / phosphopantothenate---cysteine ligase